MMDLDGQVLLLVASFTLTATAIATIGLRRGWPRVMQSGVVAGLFIYSGIGAADKGVPQHYVALYCAFLVSFLLAYRIFWMLLNPVGRRNRTVLPWFFSRARMGWSWPIVIWTYVALHLAPLLYPEVRLHELIAPPSPDLIVVFAQRFEAGESNILLKLLYYVKLLMTPFFFIALYRYHKSIWRAALLVAGLLYLSYVEGNYISRGTVAIGLGTVGLAIWMWRPDLRKTVAATAVLLTPIAILGSYIYAMTRIGGTVESLSLKHAAQAILEIETGFPREVGAPIIKAGVQANLIEYITWVFTLPLPKIFTGAIPGARINYDISQFVLGVGPGEYGWHVVLPGLVSEAVYIYGPAGFWLHGLFLGALAALVIRLVDEVPQFMFLQAYVVLLFAYVLNRGGVSAVLPTTVNEFLGFYALLCFAYFGIPRTPTRSKQEGAKWSNHRTTDSTVSVTSD